MGLLDLCLELERNKNFSVTENPTIFQRIYKHALLCQKSLEISSRYHLVLNADK